MPNPSPSSPAAPDRAPRVLYLEDHAPLRNTITECMRQAGYEVESAQDGAEGWQKFSSTRFDLVVTDLNMPNLDGLGFIQRVRESKRPIQIVVYSSDMAEPTLHTLHQLGVKGFVHKQAKWETLRQIMAKLTSLHP